MWTPHSINWPRGDSEGLGLCDHCSGVQGLLDGSWKGGREGESSVDCTHAPAWRFPPFFLSLNPTKSSFLNKPHIAGSEYQLVLGEEHICRHSKAKRGDMRGVWFASNADSWTDVWCMHHTSACSTLCMWLWLRGGEGRHLLAVPNTNFKLSAPRICWVAWMLVDPTGYWALPGYSLCIFTL